MKTQSLSTFTKDFYWAVPFFIFLAGYQSFNLFYKTHIIQAPYLIGKPLHDGMAILTQSKLNARVIKQKEDADLIEGTILNQIPLPGQNIKPHQTVLLVTSKHPEKIKTPQLLGKFYHEISAYLKNQKIKHKTSFIETARPEGLCIAQIPEADEPLENDGITLYFAKDNNAFVLFPDFHGIPLEEVKSFLDQHGITPHVFHLHSVSANHSCSHCQVKEQKPLAGSFVDLKKPLVVQLKV